MITGEEAAYKVSMRQWKRHSKPFSSRKMFTDAVKSELIKARRECKENGTTNIAQYDVAGNCTVCGEAGRCPGWHTGEELREVEARKAVKV